MIWNRLLLCLAAWIFSPAALAEQYRVGFLAYRGEAQARAAWSSTLAALKRALPEHEFVGLYLGQQQLDAALRANRLDFVVTHPGHFMLSRQPPLNWLASYIDPHYGQAGASVAGTLWVRADSRITEARQLRGQVVGAVHEQAFGGYLLVAEQLRQHGMAPDAFRMRFSGYPVDALVYLLRDGALSAAMLPTCLLEDMQQEGLIERAEFRALMVQPDSHCARSTPLYPGWSFAAVAGRDEGLLRQVSQALLQLEYQHNALWGAPVRLDEVAALLTRWQLGPRSERAPPLPLLHHLLRRYWPFLAALVVIVLALLLHHYRVTLLLLRRTQERDKLHHLMQQKEQALADAGQRILMGELATGLAHELNQPLSAIQAYAQAGALMSQGGQEQEAFSRITAETERGAAIIRRFRHWATQPLPGAEPVALASLGRELLARMQPRADGLGVRLLLHGTAGELVTVRLAVEQILNNLLGNALNAHGRAVRQAGAYVDIGIEPVSGGWQILIADNAGGIAASVIERVQQDLPASHFHGMGIGLLISHRLAQRLNGRLTLSNTGIGTQALLFLPAEK